MITYIQYYALERKELGKFLWKFIRKKNKIILSLPASRKSVFFFPWLIFHNRALIWFIQIWPIFVTFSSFELDDLIFFSQCREPGDSPKRKKATLNVSSLRRNHHGHCLYHDDLSFKTLFLNIRTKIFWPRFLAS